jgi:multiple sugar transport system substrate-binding protein
MRRFSIISSVLVIIMGIVLLSGCGTKRETAGVVTLRWVSDANPARQKQIALFEKAYPGIKVNLDWSSGGLQKVLVQMAGGNAPDLFDIYTRADFDVFAKKGAMLNLTPLVEKYKVDLKAFWPQTKPWMDYKNKVYAFPTNASSMVLFYNKKLFNEAGVPYPEATWTWQDMLRAAKKLTKGNPATGRYKQFGILWPDLLTDVLIWQNGGRVYTTDGKKCIINSPAAKEAVRFLYNLRFKYRVMPTKSEMESMASAGGWGQGGINLFAAGSIAMLPMGRWAIVRLRKAKNLDWDIAPLPKGKVRANLFLNRVTDIGRTSKHPEAAFKFLLFLRSKEYNELVSRSGDSFPALMSIAESNIFLHDPTHPKETKNQLYLEAMKYARNEEMSPYVSGLEVGRIEKYEYDRMWAELQSPEQTLDNIAGKINALIQRGGEVR